MRDAGRIPSWTYHWGQGQCPNEARSSGGRVDDQNLTKARRVAILSAKVMAVVFE